MLRCLRTTVCPLLTGCGLAWLGVAAEPTPILTNEAATKPGAGFVIDSWTTDDGLPQDTVTSILQTQDGYLWFGTLNGLVRFDGVRFQVFDENNTPGLNSSRIVYLFEDRGGTLWIGTETAGVVRFKNNRVTSENIGLGDPSKSLVSACQDSVGAVWLYTKDGGLWRHSNETLTVYSFGWERPSFCRRVVADPAGRLWLATDWRLVSIGLNPTSGPLEPQIQEEVTVNKLDFLAPSAQGGYWRMADGRVQSFHGNRLERDLGPYPWPRLVVAAACEDAQGGLWIGTLGAGLLSYDRTGHLTRLTTREGLSHDVVLALCPDREGNLWVGTDSGGLNRIKRQVFDVLGPAQGLPANAIQSVAADAQGGLWVGSNGGPLVHWREGALQHFGPAQGLTNLHVWAVMVDRSQGVWVGTRGSGVFHLEAGRFGPTPGTAAAQQEVLALHQDRAGTIWAGTSGGLVGWREGQCQSLTTQNGLSANEVRALADDPEGNLWIGTIGGGLCRYREGRVSTLRKRDGLPSDDISSLYVDGEGVLWIGTFGSGLARLRGTQLMRFTAREGLHGTSIGAILEDGQGYLWLASNAGLLRTGKTELEEVARGVRLAVNCRVYSRADGLPTRECPLGAQPAGCRTADGRLWFATAKGVVSTHPNRLYRNPHEPPVVIDSVAVDGQWVRTNLYSPDLQKPLIVPPGKEHLEVSYSGLSLSAPDATRFRYRLEGHESAWVEAGSSRAARYSRIPPGTYRFQVTACNEDGVWNRTGASLPLILEPPFWRTWWFLSAASLLCLGSITGGVYLVSTQRLQHQLERARQEEAVEKERSRIARDIHDQLGASLTHITLLSELAQGDKDLPNEVEGHARQISQTARNLTRALDEIVWAVNPANDTLEGLMSYICKYAQEYLSVAEVRCRLEVPPQLPEVNLPPEVRHHLFLAFKEAVTNIVRHAAASAAWVRLRLEPASFVLEVEDNGRGGLGANPQTLQQRNGLRNMRKRLEDIGGKLDIVSETGQGTLIRLSVPMRAATKL